MQIALLNCSANLPHYKEGGKQKLYSTINKALAYPQIVREHTLNKLFKHSDYRHFFVNFIFKQRLQTNSITYEKTFVMGNAASIHCTVVLGGYEGYNGVIGLVCWQPPATTRYCFYAG